MSYKQRSPLEVEEGGTENTTFTAYAVIISGTDGLNAFQNVSGLGTSGQVLTSTGTSSLPSWQAAPTTSTNVVFQPMSSDPVSPIDGDVWFNTTSNAFKGQANSSTITFTVT